MFTNVAADAVFSAEDVDCIYEVPIRFHDGGRRRQDRRAAQHLVARARADRLGAVVHRLKSPQAEVEIGLVGKYVDLVESYKSLNEALIHGGIGNDCRVNLHHIDSEEIEQRGAAALLADMDGILVAPGFGSRGIEGKIDAVRYAREQRGAVLRHLPGHADGGDRVRAQRVPACTAPTRPSSTPTPPYPVVDLMPEQRGVTEKGGDDAPRRVSRACSRPGSKAAAAYGAAEISERHRHRYEVNNDFREALTEPRAW